MNIIMKGEEKKKNLAVGTSGMFGNYSKEHFVFYILLTVHLDITSGR